MEWDNGGNLAGIIMDLENAEQRFSAGERSESLQQAAQRSITEQLHTTIQRSLLGVVRSWNAHKN